MKKALDKIDFNLLKILHVLLEERSVTRAASRMYVSQSAMSKTLHRLRVLFEDPLLVRGSAGLVPTARAAELIEPLREIVSKVESCLSPAEFDPMLASARVRFAAPEQFAIVVIPELLVRLRRNAPKLLIDVEHLMDHHLDMLAAGSLDFVVRREKPASDDFHSIQIYSAMAMCWCRKGHPLTRKKSVALADLCAYPLATLRSKNFSDEDINTVKHVMAEASLQNQTIVDTSHLILAIDALLRCEALMMAPDFLKLLPFVHQTLQAIPISHVPAFGRLRTDLFLVQHKRTLNSPLHRWLAQQITGALSYKPVVGGNAKLARGAKCRPATA